VSHVPLLTILVLLPAAAAVVVGFVPRRLVRTIEALALVASLAVLGLALDVAVRFRVGDPSFQMVDRYPFIGRLGVGWHLGVDGISLFLVLLTAVLFPIALAGARVGRDPKAFAAFLLLLEAACLGSFLALDVLLFFLFFELTLVPMYFLIGGWGYERRGYAAVKFFLYTFLGSALMLVGLLAVVFVHQHDTGRLTFDLVALEHTPGLSGATGIALFLAFLAAFAVKAPVFPLHTWSPDAYAESPTAGVVVLAGVMAKLGTYGIIRFDFTLFPKATVELAPVLLTFAAIGVVYGAVVAAAQRDLKRLLAYSSLAGMGFVLLGLFALTAEGMTGGILQMLNHGIFTAALFLLVGMLYERRGTFQIPRLAGLQRPAPVLAAVFTVAMMASIGLPGLNGFVGEFLILLGTFLTHRWWAVVAGSGVIFAAVYLLWAYQRVFHHRADRENLEVRDLSWRERLVLLPLVGFMVFLGVYPGPVLARIGPSVDQVIRGIETSTTYVEPAVASGVADPRPAPRGVRADSGAGRRGATLGVAEAARRGALAASAGGPPWAPDRTGGRS
jgi:NADH-quinone oxidoreductase subunit M